MGRSSTSFQPGTSGNPGGRPTALAEVVRLARDETEANIRALIRIRDDEHSPPAAVVAAVSVMFDRAFGKPVQAVTATDDASSITFLHLIAMRQFSDQLAAERAAAENAAPTISGRAEPRPVTLEDLMWPALE
jgi:hypothetical protein